MYRTVIMMQKGTSSSTGRSTTCISGFDLAWFSCLSSERLCIFDLRGSSWGASANTWQSSALVLCYSAAEYCTPFWSCSAHTSQVNVQLNCSMRLISDTLHSTPLPWLPVLSNIEPPALQRKAVTDKLVEKIVKHDS